MIDLEVLARVLQALSFVVLYVIVGFGPGFVVGLLVANSIFGRGRPIYMDLHKQAIKDAAQHNAQWHPSNERWR
ncbi:hypothetical protein CL628_01605 [bacterium]|nr:hypothetical protein [bacterium]|tara:strand:+ start:4291 stop:4512 length:222 start_codon:yes stop_codon:yes gene_type:complete